MFWGVGLHGSSLGCHRWQGSGHSYVSMMSFIHVYSIIIIMYAKVESSSDIFPMQLLLLLSPATALVGSGREGILPLFWGHCVCENY